MRIIAAALLLILAACNRSPIPAGGYSYPKSISPQDTNFYGYPVKDLLSKRDSFYWYHHHRFYKMLNEPNLSLQPLEQETYRFEYTTAFRDFLVITLANNSLTVKEGNYDNFSGEDTTVLTPIENLHFNILSRNFPIEEDNKRPYLDSMTRLYPQLLQTSYYHSLIDRTYRVYKDSISYTTTKVSLSKKTYDSLINAINASGFWQLPVMIACPDSADMADGYGFQLEANTRHKYQVVLANGCPGDTSQFTKVCQRIIEYARPKERVELVWDGKTEMMQVEDVPLEELPPKKRPKKK